MNILNKSLLIVITSIIISLLGWSLHYRNEMYYNQKEVYYDCFNSNSNIKFLPIKEHRYLMLKETISMENLTCAKNKYTRFYIQLLRKTHKHENL